MESRKFLFKEPETLKWIDKFENKENDIFWDIGSNIGLYSIYNSIKTIKQKLYHLNPQI